MPTFAHLVPAISGASDVASIAGTSDATTDVAAIAPRHIKFMAFDNTGDFPTLYFALMFAGWFGLRLKRG
ncbi:MAG: hypothetical protein ACO3VL_08925 [Ilumatobacteraceae bacterium]